MCRDRQTDAYAYDVPTGVERLAYLDLDGVIADDRHRVRHAVEREWATYFGLMDGDKVWPQGRDLYENCHLAGWDVAYLTGRREDTRSVTKRWLKRQGFDHKLPLVMRREYDRRPLAVVKASVVAATLTTCRQVWLYDDDPHVIDLVRAVDGAQGRHCTWYTKPQRMIKKALS